MFMFSDFTYISKSLWFLPKYEVIHMKSKQKDLPNNLKRGEPGGHHFTFKNNTSVKWEFISARAYYWLQEQTAR